MNNRIHDLRLYHCLSKEDIKLDNIPKESKFIESFYNKVKSIEKLLKSLEEHVIREYEEKLNKFDGVNKENLKEWRREIYDRFRSIRNKIKEIDNELSIIKKDDDGCKNAEYRIKENQLISLRKKISLLLNKYHLIEDNYRKKINNQRKRKLKIAKDYIDDDDMEINSDKVFEKIFITSNVTNSINTEYSIALEQKMDLFYLDTEMNELLDMLVDINSLLDIQQEKLNNIEENVLNSSEYMIKGINSIRRAKKSRKILKRLLQAAVLFL